MSDTMARPESEQAKAGKKKHIAIIVPETHWDREWYSTFQGFRWRLVKLTDKLLKMLDTVPDYPFYTFDGQTVVLEDYLEIRPDQKERLSKHVKDGRLLIGPWYVLPDEFLVSAEAIVRNFLVGQVIAEEFGRSMKVGYIPDPFGHLAQIPQILQGFGLDNAILMRGVGGYPEEEETEFYWEGLDGSRVILIHQLNSYCNATSLGLSGLWNSEEKPDLEKAIEKIKAEIESLGARAKTPYVLLNNGCDHVEPMAELPQILNLARERFDDYEIVHGTFEQYVDAVRGAANGLGTVKGELHGARHHPILSGVWSTRIYLKQWNNKVQNLLEKYAEPTSALAALLGRPYDRQYLRFAWKELLKNHPHDSICGCSIDQVHAEMLPRFAESEQVGELIVENNLAHIAKFINTLQPGSTDGNSRYKSLLVFNPHGWPVSGTAALKVKMGLPHNQLPKSVHIKDENGKRVPCQIVNQTLSEWEEGIPQDQRAWSYDLLIHAENIPAFGYKTLFAEWGEGAKTTGMLVATPLILENPFLRIDANSNGTLTLTDKRSGVVYPNSLLLEDTEDAGDEYDWSQIVNSRTVTNLGANASISLIETGPVRAALRIEFDFDLPESLAADRLNRSDKTTPCRVVHEVSLGADSARVDVKTTFTNTAKDHRLRMRVSVPTAAATHHAETVYGVLERPNVPPRVTNWVQAPQPTYAQRTWTCVDDGQFGLAIANVGLPEYQIIDGADGTEIGLTLLRAVGWLSRDDYIARPYNVGPKIPTPDAQCLDTYTFEYSLIPYIGSWQQAKVWKHAHLLNAPLRVMEQEPHEGDLPSTASVFSVENDGLVLSAVKMAEREDKLILRVYNTTKESITSTIKTPLTVRSAQAVNLNEQSVEEPKLQVSGSDVTFTLEPFKIATIAYEVSL